MAIRASDVRVSFGALEVLKGASFEATPGDRLGLVGPNGAGKSTLLRVIAGIVEPDGGVLEVDRNALSFLPQDGVLDSDRTLEDEMLTSFPELVEVNARLDHLEHEMGRATGDDLDRLIDEHAHALEEFERLDGHRVKALAGRVLYGLGFLDEDRFKHCDEFSGGWRMRIALAKVLVRSPQYALLDEPTNHLDKATKDWLADFLAEYRGCVVVITHDAPFLDRFANKILELRNGKTEVYQGNYTKYQETKANRLAAQANAHNRQERDIARQQRFVDRFAAKASLATRVKSKEKAIARIERIAAPEKDGGGPAFRFIHSGRGSRVVVEAAKLGHWYDDNIVLDGASLLVERGERVMLVGPNGSGKSTLLRLLAGEEEPREGEVIYGEDILANYYSQHQDETLDFEETVIAEMRAAAPDATEGQARNLLGRFLFKGDDVYKQVKHLSGGERSRLSLARFLLRPANLLLLDEPTNHLDRNSRRELLAALRDFPGAVVAASHDPAVMELATRTLEVTDGRVKELIQRSKIGQAAEAVKVGKNQKAKGRSKD